jgi:hypothetical protein
VAEPKPRLRSGHGPSLAHCTLTIRAGAKVRKSHHRSLGEALAELEREGRALEDGADGRPAGGTLLRRIEPVQIVVGRIELAGPGRLRAGVDVRGDGSSEAFTGRLKRRVVEQRDGESSYEALRRELSAEAER